MRLQHQQQLSLEQQLRIERRERQKALAQLSETEVRTKNELEVIRADTEKFMKDLVVRTEDTKNRNAKQYVNTHTGTRMHTHTHYLSLSHACTHSLSLSHPFCSSFILLSFFCPQERL